MDTASIFEHHPFDKDSAVPFYQQLKDIILEAIQERTLQPRDRLPSERELAEALGISRLTVRRALTDLVNEGRLFTQPGKGTYVRGPKLEQGIQQLMGLTEDMKSRGHTVSSRILEAALMPASVEVTQAMRLGPQEEVVLLERLRFVDGEPLSIERSYLAYRLCPGILGHDLGSGSLYTTLRQVYGLHLFKAEQSYEAVLAGSREAELLQIAPGAPVLCSERTAYLDTGQIIEYGRAWYRGDRYRFHATLLNAAASLDDLLHRYVKTADE